MDQHKVTQSKTIYWASGIVSICGIIFEVLFGALGSYLLGDGVKQYTLTISLFLTGMGIGASLSEKVTKGLILSFIWIEILIGIIGGFSSFLMFGITAYLGSGSDALFLYLVTLTIGALTGIELPILIRKANEIGVTLQRSTARVLFSDYAGGLIGGLLFVLLLRPQFGMVKTAFLVAIVNILVAMWLLYMFRHEIKHLRKHAVLASVILAILVGGAIVGEEAALSFEQKLYRDPIIHSEQTTYQKIIVTKEQGDTRLYLDGSLQFSSSDEHRYHETLVHPTMSASNTDRDVLVLGGGDGLAVRELLKYDSVQRITLVDLDPRIVELARTNPHFTDLNHYALDDPRVKAISMDAFEFMEDTDKFYDVILVDLPDPNNESLNKLYTKEFYSLLRNRLQPGGAMMVQGTSPVFAREVYWTISKTIESTGLYVENFHVDIPSFGNWGFVMASREPINVNQLKVEVDTKFLSHDVLPALMQFGKDEGPNVVDKDGQRVELKPNTLIDPHLIEKYERAWRHY
ncbi:polyamine aminopropyltransferase [Caldalkalibacillus salinus]|uniref:polyamine aminopropyltransferase n=1 Tax=Caldalkalibacillus salinus TaxID=2803787 RepID=UPI0019244681|nr:polyamine aminopropyltransferase [Caldalkalibacillus salinus]